MNTKDDAPIDEMIEAYLSMESPPYDRVSWRGMEKAAGVARKATLEEAAKVADGIAERLEGVANSQELRMRPYDAAKTWARIRSVKEVANTIRSLATQEQHND